MTLLCYIIVFSVKAKCTSLLNLCCDINIILLFYKQFDSFQTTKSPIYYLLLCSFSIFIATTTIYQIRKRFLSKSNFVIIFVPNSFFINPISFLFSPFGKDISVSWFDVFNRFSTSFAISL